MALHLNAADASSSRTALRDQVLVFITSAVRGAGGECGGPCAPGVVSAPSVPLGGSARPAGGT